LELLIEKVRQISVSKNHPQLCSIALAVSYIEPLAVLDSVFDARSSHFYIENHGQKEAHAAAEVILELKDLGGENRFQEADLWVQKWLENTIIVSDKSLPLKGPVFFAGFPFSEDCKKDKGYLFLPRWHVYRKNHYYAAIANFCVDANSDIQKLTRILWGMYSKFESYDYSAIQTESVEVAKGARLIRSDDKDSYQNSVRKGLNLIENNQIDKIVLARKHQLEVDKVNLIPLLNRFRTRFPECYSFSISPGNGQYFVGATPERLIQVNEGKLKTVALAGSAARGNTVSADARFSRDLLMSHKDVAEHGFVIDSIRRRLGQLGIEIRVQDKPHLLQLANVQHLQTFIEADVSGVSLFQIVEKLHPTAAVGGIPNIVAMKKILEIETESRGYYAGPIGWMDAFGNGEFVVGIRSMNIQGNQIDLFAGAGIVDGSDPEKEFQETEMKFQAMLNTLGI
jgi:menaquinone-specific isochorismate synthase